MSNNRTKQVEALAGAFAALGNPNRLRVFLELAACCGAGCKCDPTKCVGDLSDGVCCAPSTLSHHLKELQHAGLIRSERRGRNIDCCIDTERVAALAGTFRKLVPDSTWVTWATSPKEKP